MRVVYKPVERHREQTGLISKTVVYTYKQVTEIVNNRSETAVVTYTDQIPKSSDEKLKVKAALLSFNVYAIVVLLCYQLLVPGDSIGASPSEAQTRSWAAQPSSQQPESCGMGHGNQARGVQ